MIYSGITNLSGKNINGVAMIHVITPYAFSEVTCSNVEETKTGMTDANGICDFVVTETGYYTIEFETDEDLVQVTEFNKCYHSEFA